MTPITLEPDRGTRSFQRYAPFDYWSSALAHGLHGRIRKRPARIDDSNFTADDHRVDNDHEYDHIDNPPADDDHDRAATAHCFGDGGFHPASRTG